MKSPSNSTDALWDVRKSTASLMAFILISPLAGLLFGMFIAYLNDIPNIIFTPNLVAIALGIPLAMLIGARIQEISSHLLLMNRSLSYYNH